MLLTKLNGHLRFVQADGGAGHPIRRTCDACRKQCFLGADGRYHLFDPRFIKEAAGGVGYVINPANPPPIHELCIRPYPRAT